MTKILHYFKNGFKALVRILYVNIDKVLHFLVCYFITSVVWFLLASTRLEMYAALFIACVFSGTVAFLKEVYDSRHDGHSCELLDLIADVVGILVALFLIVLIIKHAL